jgi:hypothetical protein
MPLFGLSVPDDLNLPLEVIVAESDTDAGLPLVPEGKKCLLAQQLRDLLTSTTDKG